MNVEGKKVNFVSVPKTLKSVGSKVASVAKTATRKLSNWYASKVKMDSFEKMSLDKQAKILKKQEQYFDDKANRLSEKDVSLASARLEYDANDAEIKRIENTIDDIKSDDMDNNIKALRIEELENTKNSLEDRNDEIKSYQEKTKQKIKSSLMANSNYEDIAKKYESNLKNYEIDFVEDSNVNSDVLLDDLSRVSEDHEKTSDRTQIENNLGISFSRLDDRTEVEKIGNIFDRKLKELIENLINDISKYNSERIDSVLISERSKRDEALKSASRRIDILNSQNANLERSLTNVQTDLENSNSENKRLEAEIERLKSENDLLVQQNKSLNEEKKAVHEELSKEKTRSSDLKNKISDLERNIVNVQKAFGVDIMNLQEAHKLQIENLKKTYDGKLEDLEKTYKEKMIASEEVYENEIETLKKENDNLREERSNIARILSGDLAFSKDLKSNENSDSKSSESTNRKNAIDSLNDIKNDLTNNMSIDYTVDSNVPGIDDYKSFFTDEERQIQKHK